MTESTFVKRVVLKNYRSIASCDVPLGPLSFLVGPNGSGKSNFLDALRFVADSLNATLEQALRERGGLREVRRRSSGRPTHFSIQLQLVLPDHNLGEYSFRIGSLAGGRCEVQSEKLSISRTDLPVAFYEVSSGEIGPTSIGSPPAVSSDRLYLVNLSGLPEFRPVYDALTHMGFYSLNPDRIRDLQPPATMEVLARDGSNLTSVLRRLELHHPQTKQRIQEYLSKVVPGIGEITVKTFGPKETVGFRQLFAPLEVASFTASNMSDGTLRALGNLVALFQFTNGDTRQGSLVGIEEPETALHPAAADVLRDGLREASRTTQVLVTSYSPDLLDDPSISEDQILAVATTQGATQIGRIDEAGRTSLRDRLFTAGELLRLDQLQPALLDEHVGTEKE